MHVQTSFIFTLIGSSDSLNLHIRSMYVILLIRYLERITHLTRCLKFSLRDYRYSYFLLFLSFPLIPYIRLNACSIPLFICYHMWTFICTAAVILIHHSDYIACSGYFRFSVYMWGILLAFIHRRLLSRLRFHIFWEAGRDRIFLVLKEDLVLTFDLK